MYILQYITLYDVFGVKLIRLWVYLHLHAATATRNRRLDLKFTIFLLNKLK